MTRPQRFEGNELSFSTSESQLSSNTLLAGAQRNTELCCLRLGVARMCAHVCASVHAFLKTLWQTLPHKPGTGASIQPAGSARARTRIANTRAFTTIALLSRARMEKRKKKKESKAHRCVHRRHTQGFSFPHSCVLISNRAR